MLKPYEVLERGADLIDERGWWPQSSTGGPLCASNAMRQAANANECHMAGQYALAGYLSGDTSQFPPERRVHLHATARNGVCRA